MEELCFFTSVLYYISWDYSFPDFLQQLSTLLVYKSTQDKLRNRGSINYVVYTITKIMQTRSSGFPQSLCHCEDLMTNITQMWYSAVHPEKLWHHLLVTQMVSATWIPTYSARCRQSSSKGNQKTGIPWAQISWLICCIPQQISVFKVNVVFR